MERGVTRSAKDLWVLISGDALLKSKELVGTELEQNISRILLGGLFYKEPDPSSVEQLKQKIGGGSQLEFLQRISHLLNVDILQCYDLFCSYLLYEYRGTQSTLKAWLSNEHHMQTMFMELWNFYYNERLHCLLCLKHIISHWQDNAHPYKELYDAYFETINKDNAVLHNVVKQLQILTTIEAPTKDTHGPCMTENLVYRWAACNLKEQIELLEILLLYFKDMESTCEDVVKLLSLFLRHGFGRRQPFRQYVNEAVHGLTHIIGYLEALIIIETLELEWLCRCQEDGMNGEHFLLKDPDGWKKLDNMISIMGNHKYHAPILLAWMAVRECTPGQNDPAIIKRQGTTALQLGVFCYITSMLRCPVLVGEEAVPNLAHNVIYGLMCVLLTLFQTDTLGDSDHIFTVAQCCLAYTNIADDFWEKGLDNGVGLLMKLAMDLFPLRFKPLLNLVGSISGTTEQNCRKAVTRLQVLSVFTEYMDNTNVRDMVATQDPSVWRLVNNKLPYGTGTVIIPRDTVGIVLPQTDTKGRSIIQWQCSVNGWQVCLCELHAELKYISQGSGSVDADTLDRFKTMAFVLKTVLKKDPRVSGQLTHVIDTMTAGLHRFSVFPTPPVDLMAVCVDVFAALAIKSPREAWQKLSAIDFLPFMTGHPHSIFQLASGMHTNMSVLGMAVASQECVLGKYNLLRAFLHMFVIVVEPLSALEQEDSKIFGCVVFILREIFPAFLKWFYASEGQKEQIGQSCLSIFHLLLAIPGSEGGAFAKPHGKIQHLCAFSLLYGEARHALMKIVCTGESALQQVVQHEDSILTGLGQQLMTMIRLSLSVLNRLLLLRRRASFKDGQYLPQSKPLEKLLFPPQHTRPHAVLTVAYYAFQHYSPTLATLAVQLLKRFAKEFPKSLLACLGSEAEAIRDHFLYRLSSFTEDVRLKVAILEFLTVCIAHQPGLIEMFVNVSIQEGKLVKQDEVLSSCLQAVLDILKEKKEGIYYCPNELHRAAVEFIHCLWSGHQMLAVEVMKNEENFWSLLYYPLLSENMGNCKNLIIAYILRTLTLETYYTYASSKTVTDKKEDIFEAIKDKRLLLKWSRHVHDSCPANVTEDLDASTRLGDTSLLGDVSHDAFLLLTAWRDLLVVFAKYEPLPLTREEKTALMKDIIITLRAKMSCDKSSRISIMLSELYLMLLQIWKSDAFLNGEKWSKSINILLDKVANNAANIHPRFQLAIVSIGTAALHVIKDKGIEEPNLRNWVTSICLLVKEMMAVTEKYVRAGDDNRLKLAVVTISFLKDLLSAMSSPDEWLPVVQYHSIIPGLFSQLVLTLQLHKGLPLSHAVLNFLVTIAVFPKVAELLSGTGMLSETILLLSTNYLGEKVQPLLSSRTLAKNSLSWFGICSTFTRLITILLHTQKHFALPDALNFVGVHLERMHLALQQVRPTPTTAVVQEAVVTAHLVYQLSFHQQTWRLEHPSSLSTLMGAICDSCHAAVAYLIRPGLLQHVIYSKSVQENMPPFMHLEEEKKFRRLSSIDDVDKPTPDLVNVQNKLLELLAVGLSTLRLFSPSMYGLLSDQTVDYAQWHLLLHLSFSTPSVDQEGPFSIGSVLSCVNMCLRSLTKNEHAASPSRASQSEGPLPLERGFLLYVLESSLVLLLSQAILALLHPSISPRDKQLVRRELGAELNSVMSVMNRYLRKGTPLSPAGSSTSLISPGQQKSAGAQTDWPFIRLVSSLVDKLLK